MRQPPAKQSAAESTQKKSIKEHEEITDDSRISRNAVNTGQPNSYGSGQPTATTNEWR